MATLIRLRRKKSKGNAGVALAAGEAYYNLADKQLFIGNSDEEAVTSKKHIAQITPLASDETTIKFQIGEGADNIYEKKITAEAMSGTIGNAKNAANVTSSIGGVAISTLFNMTAGKPASIKNAYNATVAKYADGNLNKTIDQRLNDTETKLNNVSSVKVDTAGTADVAKDLQDLSFDTGTGATIKLSWGEGANKKTISRTISMDKVSGTMENAENLTTSIQGVALSDIFEADHTTAKTATKLKTARTITANLSSTTSDTFDGTSDVTVGVTGLLDIAHGGTSATTAAEALRKLGLTTVTATDINQLSGISSNVQSQLDGKADVNHTHKYAGSTSTGGAATSANKLTTARTIKLQGDVTGSVSFDGSSNVTITTTAAALQWKSF